MATEIFGIELQLRGADGIERDLNNIESRLNRVSGRRGQIELQTNLASAQREIIKYESEVKTLKSRLKELEKTYKSLKNSSEELTDEQKEAIEKYEDLADALEKANVHLQEQRVLAQECRYALKNLASASFVQNFHRISSAVAHVGSALQSLGNAMTRLGTPFRSLLQGTFLGAGMSLFSSVSEGLTKGFSRYDTMKKYRLMMEEFEKSNYTAEQSVNELDLAVRGLPTGLDEIVGMAQRYTLSLGDMQRGTQLAIATNNAFLASMSTEAQQYQGMLQLQDLVNGKKLNSREWMSLGASMGKAINEVGKEFGYTNENMGEFRELLYGGKIKTKDFLDALIKVGTGNGKIAEMATISKQTWEAFSRNVGNAFSRMTYGILTSLDEISKATTGKTVNALLIDLLPKIDEATEKIKTYIRDNKDAIVEFVETLKGVDWIGLIRGFADGFILLAKAIGGMAKLFDGRSVRNIGRILSISALFGGWITAFGGFLKGTRHIWGAFGALLKEVLNAHFGGKGGLFGKIFELFGGKNADKTIAEAPKAMTTLRNVFKSLEGTLTVAGQIAIPALTGLAVTKAFKEILKDFRSIGWLMQDIDWGKATVGMVAFGGFIGAFIKVGEVISTGERLKGAWKALEGTAIVGGITWLASFAVSETMRQVRNGVGFFKEMTESLNAITENLKNLNTSSMGNSAKKVGEMLSYLNSFTDTLSGTMVNGEQQGGMKLVPESVKLSVQNLASIITSLGEISDKFKEYKKSFVDGATIEKVGDSLGLLMEKLTYAFETYTYGFDESITNEAKNAIKNISEMLGSIIGQDGLLALARKFIFETADIPGVTNPIEGAKAPLQRMFDGLAEIYRGYQKAFAGLTHTSAIVSRMTDLEQSIESIRQIFKKMRKIQGYDMERVGNGTQYKAIQMIQDLIEQLKTTFKGDAVNSLKTSIQEFADSVNEMMTAVDNLGGEHEIEATVKLKNNKVIGADKVVKAIDEAVINITNAWDSVPYSLSRTINLNIGGRVNAGGYNSAVRRTGNHVKNGTIIESLGGYASRKGVLYRADGGSIFKPRGTDRIPAMLTEGEYVQRREAVNMFGIDFMRKVNSLDVRGAMQALLSRGGASASVGRQSVVNNTVNNNQRVTQNINTNNPRFASMRMSRYVGAL